MQGWNSNGLWGCALVLLQVSILSASESLALAIPFAVSHNFEESLREPCEVGKTACWAKTQVETACTYGHSCWMDHRRTELSDRAPPFPSCVLGVVPGDPTHCAARVPEARRSLHVLPQFHLQLHIDEQVYAERWHGTASQDTIMRR